MGGYGIFRDCMILWREEVCHFVSVSLFEHILFSFTLSCNYLSFFLVIVPFPWGLVSVHQMGNKFAYKF